MHVAVGKVKATWVYGDYCHSWLSQNNKQNHRKNPGLCTTITAEHQSWICIAFSSESDNRSLCKRINQ